MRHFSDAQAFTYIILHLRRYLSGRRPPRSIFLLFAVGSPRSWQTALPASKKIGVSFENCSTRRRKGGDRWSLRVVAEGMLWFIFVFCLLIRKFKGMDQTLTSEVVMLFASICIEVETMFNSFNDAIHLCWVSEDMQSNQFDVSGNVNMNCQSSSLTVSPDQPSQSTWSDG